MGNVLKHLCGYVRENCSFNILFTFGVEASLLMVRID